MLLQRHHLQLLFKDLLQSFSHKNNVLSRQTTLVNPLTNTYMVENIYTSTPHICRLVVQVTVGEEQIEVIHAFLGTCVLKVVYFPLDSAHVNGIFHYLEVVLNWVQ